MTSNEDLEPLGKFDPNGVRLVEVAIFSAASLGLGWLYPAARLPWGVLSALWAAVWFVPAGAEGKDYPFLVRQRLRLPRLIAVFSGLLVGSALGLGYAPLLVLPAYWLGDMVRWILARFGRWVVSLPWWSRMVHWLQKRLERRDDTLLGEVVILGLGFHFAKVFTPECGALPDAGAVVLGTWALARWVSGWSMPSETLALELGRTLLSLTLAAAAGLAVSRSYPLWQGTAQIMFLSWTVVIIAAYRILIWLHMGKPGVAGENIRWILAAFAGVFLMTGFARISLHGTGDAGWYATMLADMITQVQAGIFPVWLGQSEYQFNGAIYPLRVAPGFHLIGAGLDLLTWRSLGVYALQNLQITLIGLAAFFSAYLCLSRILPHYRWISLGLAFLFMACPGVIGLAYNTDLLMSWTTVPWLPVIWLVTIQSFRDEADWRQMVLWGTALGICWWGHSPIALWMTIFAGGAQVLRLLIQRPFRANLLSISVGGITLGLVAAYPIISVMFYPPEASIKVAAFQEARADVILYFLNQVFPAVLKPLSPLGRQLSDFQLGWSLWALLACALVLAVRTRRREARVLVMIPVVLAILVTPWPIVGTYLWQAVPAFVRNTTSNWVMNRLYLVMGSSVVFAFAAGAADWLAGRRERWQRLFPWLVVAIAWSGGEAWKFSHGSAMRARPPETAANMIRIENNTLTRFSYNIFPGYPSWFTHGVMEGSLENRILSQDMKTVVIRSAAEAKARGWVIAKTEFVRQDASAVLTQPLHLGSGKHYVLDFEFEKPEAARGVLQVLGSSLFREYAWPEYGFARSFGVGGEHTSELPLWTSLPQGEDVNLRFVPADGPAQLNNAFPLARVTLFEYDPEQLSVFVRAWLPYRATVRLSAPGWLETPRMYQDSYAARVNGKRVPCIKSPDGLAAIQVPAGNSNVELKYKPPFGLEMAFWISLVSIAVVLTVSIGVFFCAQWNTKHHLCPPA